jgi:hypothetical protein
MGGQAHRHRLDHARQRRRGPALWSGAYVSDEIGRLNDEVLREADSMLLGRATYDGFAAAWPSRSGDPFAGKFNATPKHVVSATLERADWNNSALTRRLAVCTLCSLATVAACQRAA